MQNVEYQILHVFYSTFKNFVGHFLPFSYLCFSNKKKMLVSFILPQTLVLKTNCIFACLL